MNETIETYTNRNHEVITIEHLSEDGTEMRMTNGWNMFVPDVARGKLKVGENYILEKRGFNTITGLMHIITAEWFWHDSDELLDEQTRKWQEEQLRKDRERLEVMRDEWTAGEAGLPEYLRKRLERFHANGGELFDTRHWGYELITSQLIVLYAASEGEVTDEIRAVSAKYGASGNQHDFAQWAVKILAAEGEEAVTALPGAMTPIIGDPDYSNLS